MGKFLSFWERNSSRLGCARCTYLLTGARKSETSAMPSPVLFGAVFAAHRASFLAMGASSVYTSCNSSSKGFHAMGASSTRRVIAIVRAPRHGCVEARTRGARAQSSTWPCVSFGVCSFCCKTPPHPHPHPTHNTHRTSHPITPCHTCHFALCHTVCRRWPPEGARHSSTRVPSCPRG